MDKLLQAPVDWARAEKGCPSAGNRGALGMVLADTGNGHGHGHGNGMSDTAVGYLVRDVNRSLARALQARIASHGVSMGQWFFLRALWDEDGLTQRELSQRVGMMEPTTVTALNGMERRGLIERVRNLHDRRKVNIFLTPKGRGLQDVLMPCSIEANEQAILGISPTDLETAMTVLHQMLTNLTSGGADEDALSPTEGDVGLA